jgi:hypothetical protein
VVHSAARLSSTSTCAPVSSVSPNKANFVPLNIQTIYELAEEIRISSLPALAYNSNKAYFSSSIPHFDNATIDIIKSMQDSLSAFVDRSDFLKQMEQSRVVGKEVRY